MNIIRKLNMADAISLEDSSELASQIEMWRENPSWEDEAPVTKVTVPKGTLCRLSSTFKVGLPPEKIYDIVMNTDKNQHVFKSIKEVKYRKVLKSENHGRLVEVEHAANWKFLSFTETIDVRLLFDEDRRTNTVSFKLAKEGFLKKFQGTWEIHPIQVDSKRVASLIKLEQEIQPCITPPPPISWYVRGVTTQTWEAMITDLQSEGRRIREDNTELASLSEEINTIEPVIKKDLKVKTGKSSTWASHKNTESSKWHATRAYGSNGVALTWK